MPISTTCPKCQALFRLPEELAGRKVKCQKCAALFVAPSAGADTTMPGVPVAVEVEPEETPVSAANAAPLHGIGLPPMPTDSPSTPARNDDVAEFDTYSDSPRKAPPVATKKPDAGERPGRARRGEQPKAGSSKLGIILGILGFLLLAFVVCGVATWIWYAVTPEKQKKGPPIAKDGFRKDGFRKKDPGKFGEFPNPIQNDGFNGVVQNRPDFDGFKDGKLPEPPPPGPPGSIAIIFGPDGKFHDANHIAVTDPKNLNQTRNKLYMVRLEAGYTYQFDMHSDNPMVLDPLLNLRDERGALVAHNDDIEASQQRDARLIYTATESGIYRLEATYWDPETAPNPPPGQLIPPAGKYRLTVRHVK